MNFLIFGGTGFVGRNLARYLRKRGDNVLCVSRNSSQKDVVAMDISKDSNFQKINFKPDVVVNCASRIPVKGKTSKDPHFLKELFQTNVVGAVNICNWAVTQRVPTIVNCSTLVVVKKPWPEFLSETYFKIPEGPHVGYCMSKLSQEQLMSECVKGSDTRLLHLRLSAVYGEGMPMEGIIFNLLEKMDKNENIFLTNGEKNTLDFINVEDVAQSIHAIAHTRTEFRILNMASGKQISVHALANYLKEIIRSSSKIIDMNNDAPVSRANVSVEKLKQVIGTDVYNSFIPLEKGLYSLVNNLNNEDIYK